MTIERDIVKGNHSNKHHILTCLEDTVPNIDHQLLIAMLRDVQDEELDLGKIVGLCIDLVQLIDVF